METDVVHWLASDNGYNVLVAVFTLLILGGMGFPIPEDIPILLGGVAAAKSIVSCQSIFIVSYLGVILADQIVFLIGRLFGTRLLAAGTKSPFFPSITPERVIEVREGLRKRRLLVIFISRHLFPIRSVTFITAGALKIPFWEFLFADALAALVSVSAILWLGYILGNTLTPEAVQHIAEQAHIYIFALAILICLGVWLNYSLKTKRRAATAEPDQAPLETANVTSLKEPQSRVKP